MDPEKYYRLSMRASVAALCQSFGWHGILGGTCDTLSDIGVRYLINIGRNISSYAAHAERTDPSPFDVLQAFNQLDISIESLEAYFEKVEAPQLPGTPPPLLPVPVSQGKHVHNVTSRKACHHKKGPVSREEGSAGEGEEEEEEESEEDEMIPIHLPPLPLVTKDKEEEQDDNESGIHMITEDDDTAIATPTSLKSPSVTGGSAGLPSYAHLRTLSEADEEGGASRRSSSSDEMLSTNKPTEVGGTQLSSTANSPAAPLNNTNHPSPHLPPAHTVHSISSSPPPPPPSLSPHTVQSTSPSHRSPPLSPSPHTVQSISPSPSPPLSPPHTVQSTPSFPPPPPDVVKDVVKEDLPPSNPPPLISSIKDSKPVKPVPRPLSILSDSPVGTLKSPPSFPPPQLPPLHLMSPRGPPLSPAHVLPQLSPFHKTPPTSPFLSKSVRPVLHPLSGTHQTDDNSPTRSPTVSFPLRTVSVNVPKVYPPSPPRPLPPAAPPSLPPSLPSSLPPSPLPPSLPPSLSPSPSPPLPDPKRPEPVKAHIESDFSFSSSSSSPSSLADSIKIPLPSLDDDSKSPIPPPSLLPSLPPLPPQSTLSSSHLPPVTSHTSPISPQTLAPLPPRSVGFQTTPSHSLVPPTHPLPHSFGYSKDNSPLSNQEEEEDTSESDTSESTEFRKPTPPLPPAPSLLVTSEPPAIVPSLSPGRPLSPPPPLSSPSHSLSLSPSSTSSQKQRSLTIRIKKSNLSQDLSSKEQQLGKGGTTDLIVSSSSYKKVDSILPLSPPLPPAPLLLPPPPPTIITTSPSRLIGSSTSKHSSSISVSKGSEMIVETAFIKNVDSIEAPPSSLLVKIPLKYRLSSRLLMATKKEKTSSSEEEEERIDKKPVKVTIPRLSTAGSSGLGVKISKEQRSGGHVEKRRGKGRGLKRSIAIDIPDEPKKKISRNAETSSSSSSSSESSEEEIEVESFASQKKGKSKTKMIQSLRPVKKEGEREERSKSPGGLKLRLKLPQQPPVSTVSPGTSSLKSRRSSLRASSSSSTGSLTRETLTAHHHHAKKKTQGESLFVKSSPSIKVPSINIKKSAPSLVITSSTLQGVVGGVGGAGTTPEVYICPICKRPDDGTPMICCDNCDVWLHMHCVGLACAPPDNKKWFCPPCSSKKSKKLKRR
ncbi:PREDICTED: transcription initiation factor TFIID subunit 3-like [Amphimedon queenslandica]|uniref:PHD-type domain-containing protein n=1 Tax=Amphimedon queenslandica TaxID=400682 RepID=A0A1X7VPH6_AMPQE|nr:PREDICTED: transcription initiation factor TFIID subunit 3-like [Amphimedon queenslandica]|eukprot:XP_011408227.2 PREDICTED: transcription initiation factor TFIID subunit 3-like [Amphimedon queenslandica]